MTKEVINKSEDTDTLVELTEEIDFNKLAKKYKEEIKREILHKRLIGEIEHDD